MKKQLLVLFCVVLLVGCEASTEYPIGSVCNHETKVTTDGRLYFPDTIEWVSGGWVPVNIGLGEVRVKILINESDIVFINEYGDIIDENTKGSREFDPTKTAVLTFHNEYRVEGAYITVTGDLKNDDEGCRIYVKRID